MLWLQFEHDMTIWNKGLLKPAVCPMVDWVHYGSSQVASHISWFDEQHHPAVRIYLSNEQNLSVKMPLKLGSNWKSVGIGTDMRRLAPGNSRVTRLAWFEHKWHKIPPLIQINFGFCKGDDNFGGRKRKELDDFLKSLGKQMTLKMYRLEDTERVRMKLREDRRREVRERAERWGGPGWH